MKTFILLLFTLILSANHYVAVSNKSIKRISVEKLKALYLKKSFYVHDLKIVPVNLAPKSSARTSFEVNILKMNFSRLKTYWMKQHYLGHRPPISLKSQKSVISFVKKVDGAIGYIEQKNIDDDLAILYEWED